MENNKSQAFYRKKLNTILSHLNEIPLQKYHIIFNIMMQNK